MKLVHTEYQVNHKTQSFWVKVVHLVPKVQRLAGLAVCTIRLAPATNSISTQYTKPNIHSHIGFFIFFYNKMMWCQRQLVSARMMASKLSFHFLIFSPRINCPHKTHFNTQCPYPPPSFCCRTSIKGG